MRGRKKEMGMAAIGIYLNSNKEADEGLLEVPIETDVPRNFNAKEKNPKEKKNKETINGTNQKA